MPKYAFITRDWKGTYEPEQIDRYLQIIDAPARMTELPEDGSDGFVAVVHDASLQFTSEQWEALHDMEEGVCELGPFEDFVEKIEYLDNGCTELSLEDAHEFRMLCASNNDPMRTPINDPDIQRRGRPFTLDDNGQKVYQ